MLKFIWRGNDRFDARLKGEHFMSVRMKESGSWKVYHKSGMPWCLAPTHHSAQAEIRQLAENESYRKLADEMIRAAFGRFLK